MVWEVGASQGVWYNEKWKRGRVVEGARLEIVWAEMSRRFESSRFRQEVAKTAPCVRVFVTFLLEKEKI